ncbi:MAG: sugar transferase [Deltaproteobacteria bacterium]|nr:sugar transferase [Deltaproteobacteria bacterium]
MKSSITKSSGSGTGMHTSVMAVPSVKEPFLKRPMDIMLSTFMLILSMPVSLLIALAIKLEDGGSILYRQERWGRGGSHFRAYKFRTMVGNSDQDLWWGTLIRISGLSKPRKMIPASPGLVTSYAQQV